MGFLWGYCYTKYHRLSKIWFVYEREMSLFKRFCYHFCYHQSFSSRKWLMLYLSMTCLKGVYRYFACVKQLVLRNGTLSWHKATVCWSKWPSLLNACTKILTFITIHKSLKPRFSALDLSIPFRWVDWSFLYRNNCNLRNSHIIFLLT